ncbi:phospholipid-transporting ATPase ABCA3-like [Phacochoerus africanus]|uniref:phospholipid-transporting ATPase ABCA3-like n=1 Tax=Phacochoerus africanus TaxID=41426 RepID=UPI001FDA22CE|nr:phospholipid-transporting ATPase ABCA3-like [Phacochoerus africanus]
MDLLTFNQFAVLLWKNFTLKRRQFFNLMLEILAALVFPVMLLLFRSVVTITAVGPYNFTSQPISTLPSFLKNAEEWKLVYVPSNIDVLKEITENVKRNLNISIQVQGFSSETEFEKHIKHDFDSQKVLAAIVFDYDFKNSSDPLPLQVKYRLRFSGIERTVFWPDRQGWKTSLLFPNFPSGGPRNPSYQDGGSPGYIREGFLAVQHALDKAIMLYHDSSAKEKLFDGISIFVQRFPYPAHPQDRLFLLTGDFFPLMFILMFAPTVLSIMRFIVWEKESRLKEYQLTIGLKNWMIWTAYLFTFLLFYIFIICSICVLFFIFNEQVFLYSDYSFIFVFLVCYAIASTFFCFLVSTFFNRASLVASAGSFLYFASFFPFNTITENYGQITLTRKVAACLSPNIALALGIKLLVKLELKLGVKWKHLWTPANLEDELIFRYMLGMLLFDAFFYGLVTWYVENVFPGQYGMPQPWYFFLMRSYWFGQARIKRKEMKDCRITLTKYFEAEPTSLVAGIRIKHLYKKFGDKVAINNMSLNLYKGQITILLGQNGAGKTTVLSVLTGCYRPTRGEVCIYGYDISKNIREIRENMGFCPQHDLLFNDLTLSEHIFFYSVVKRIQRKIPPLEVDNMLSTFNLLEKRDTFSESLTGGMKRKLSIIIALLGSPKVVILDEPSSGMDPVSRRATWDVLQQFKHKRTILLTSHYMDEADILGDRIAIMVKGTLQCCGSSIFLKKIYGAGYHVVIEREPWCDAEKISAVIYSRIPDAILENSIGTELSFILPKEHTHRFEALFNELEEKQKELGIASFGASITTMKEVFLKVNKLADSQTDVRPSQSRQKRRQDMEQNESVSRSHERPVFPSLNETANIKFNTGFPLYRQQFHSMFIKRALFNWRNWRLTLLQISVILFVTTYLLTTLSLDFDLPARELDLSQYGRTIVPYSISGNSDLALNLIKNLKIFLKLKNQELRRVQGNVKNYILESKEYRDFSITAFSIKVEKNKTIVTILFNNEAYHSAGTSLAVLDNILFMSLSGLNASIRVSNKPQPLPLYGSNVGPTNGVQVALSLAFGMALVVSSFCLQTVTERTTKAKHIQFVSGVYLLTYWLAALLWDLIYFSIICCFILGEEDGNLYSYPRDKPMSKGVGEMPPAGLVLGPIKRRQCLLLSQCSGSTSCYFGVLHLALYRCLLSQGVFIYCRVDAFFANYHFLDTMMIFLLYGWSVVPLMYLGSLLFSSSPIAYIKLTLFNYFSTVFSLVFHIMMQHTAIDMHESARTFMGNALMMLPNYNFAMSISKFFDDYMMKKLCTTHKQFQSIYVNCNKTFTENSVYSFGEHGIAKFLISLAALGLIFLLLLFCLESTFWSLKNFFFHKIVFAVYKIFRKRKKATVSTQVINEYVDKDVENERKRVLALLPKLKAAPVLLSELTKIYFKCPVVMAVRNVSLLVQKYECFGLLGLNGAGKTTIFKMLTGEETLTSGVVLIKGNNITENIRKVRSRIGYCPQADTMLNHMTGRELLIMYARLWGVPEPDISMYVEAFLHSMHIEDHADKLVHTYSGGNKRKLNTAIALMGKSSVIFLDEPSTGMDPVARHRLWDTVTWICKTGKTIIITSHRYDLLGDLVDSYKSLRGN